ncbi:Fer3-like protein [Strongyloides ratti]|uniref:Fer3-like protein n=1 Tax=Strongyloides ratti TaxID=34506 RepID=A0A090LB10_STRRB|nr:Fer3-like protein [Strongyloides ratti]CEF66981.1 Fer3-like protein [Strongyloides ratti]
MSYPNFYSPNFQYPISSPEDFYPNNIEKNENNYYKDYQYYYHENEVSFNNLNYLNTDNEGNYKSQARRDAANERERKRMKSLNKGFDELRQKLPSLSYKKKLSKVDTLKHAISYIQQLHKMLQNAESNKKYAMVNIVDLQKLNNKKKHGNSKFEEKEDKIDEKHILNAKVWIPH